MSARRPLLTALGATTLLTALWFVPSANATAPGHTPSPSAAPAAASTGTVTGVGIGVGTGPTSVVPLTLADTGSTDTAPYVMAGTLFLTLGAGFVTFSVHRSRAL